MEYESESELNAVLESFENCTVSRGDWGHPEHLIVAYFYCIEGDEAIAYWRMKSGILNLLDAFGIDKSKEMPFHETLTQFWIKVVFEFIKERGRNEVLADCRELIRTFSKDYPLEFYSRELLFSDKARERFLPPEKPLPWSTLPVDVPYS
ncbi:MAG: hypothetical protein DWQ47_04920 [Acidobacteria bacterium]|nr:MAG: hypothetical protein DWQ32_08470 [Acidobacteriota bacterium]REK01724.1 MAG: hypothetical protein DWQ38_04905 [Acidobacteriota bacterium]REK14680.1 MAG: hypothetical protein DWQ43_14160 [Acidobacteriota bacterium]REK45395.1 MAG: hypothetical protein DWQ47_04920 [Acidobacteriota bacterium]